MAVIALGDDFPALLAWRGKLANSRCALKQCQLEVLRTQPRQAALLGAPQAHPGACLPDHAEASWARNGPA